MVRMAMKQQADFKAFTRRLEHEAAARPRRGMTRQEHKLKSDRRTATLEDGCEQSKVFCLELIDRKHMISNANLLRRRAAVRLQVLLRRPPLQLHMLQLLVLRLLLLLLLPASVCLRLLLPQLLPAAAESGCISSSNGQAQQLERQRHAEALPLHASSILQRGRECGSGPHNCHRGYTEVVVNYKRTCAARRRNGPAGSRGRWW